MVGRECGLGGWLGGVEARAGADMRYRLCFLTCRCRRRVQFGAIRQLAMLDLEAEPDLPGVRFPQAAHTQGWSCSLDSGPNGANTHCIHDTAGCVCSRRSTPHGGCARGARARSWAHSEGRVWRRGVEV